MMWQEFENLAGYEVTYETYTNIIEPMYMALPESVSKADFIKMLDKKAFALPTKKEMVKEMKKIANIIFENCGIRSYHEEREKLEEIAQRYAKRFYGMERSDNDCFWFLTNRYAYRGVRQERGCSFPEALVIYRGNTELERIVLVK